MNAKERRPIVFLLTMPTVSKTGDLPDLTPLNKFGTVKVLVSQGENPMTRSVETMGNIRRRLEEANVDFDRDFFVTAGGGGTLSAMLFGVVLCEWDVRRINWLSFRKQFDKETQRMNQWYDHFVMDLAETEIEGFPHSHEHGREEVSP